LRACLSVVRRSSIHVLLSFFQVKHESAKQQVAEQINAKNHGITTLAALLPYFVDVIRTSATERAASMSLSVY